MKELEIQAVTEIFPIFTMAQQNPLTLAADNNPNLLPLLHLNPSLASAQDEHGYSILHAAASYNHLDLLRAMVNEFHVDPNIKDEDGETSLFVVETVEAAQVLVDELGADAQIKNDEGQTAEEKIQTEGDFTTVAEFLRESRIRSRSHASGRPNGGHEIQSSSGVTLQDGLQYPPPLPPNVTVNVGTMEEHPPAEGEVDPAFRARIEELASREDFQEEEGQRQLREIITDAVRGIDTEGSERDVRRRLE